MDKLNFETNNFVKKNIEKIESLFPNITTEMKGKDGILKKGIDFEKLKQELSEEVIEGEESYDFTWVGKKASIIEANKPIRKTLRPCIEESKNWETTENIYIEGDNLEVLKLLQESYLNSIKMIYIDPPYNTGNDFIYKDDFAIDKDKYNEQIGLYDEEENRLFLNTESNGRFHSDWCSMMYPRLKLAYNLLSEDGVIFISIDDNEIDNLKKICNEVFGEENFITCICWHKKTQASFLSKQISNVKEFLLFYKKNKDITTYGSLTNVDKLIEMINISNDISKRILRKENVLIENGAFNGLLEKGVYGFGVLKIELLKDVYVNNGKPDEDIELFGRFKWTQEKMESSFKEGDIYHIKSVKSLRTTVEKKNKIANIKPIIDLLSKKLNGEIPTNTDASNEMKELFNGINIMDYPKPSKLIKYLIRAITYENNNSIILDFFSGSATTAHAVMQLNAEDGGNRKFIMVNLPEPCSEDSEAYKVGFKNICEIGKERIRRAGEKINQEIINNNKQLKIGEEEKEPVDIGFRVFKVDSSNMKDIYYSANEYNQEMLSSLESNIKDGRTDLDLLYGIMLDWGLPLSLNHKIEEIDGIDIHIVDNHSLIACFAEKIPEKVVREIAKKQPIRVVFKDSSFASSPEKINVEEIFKLLAPGTTIKVI